MSTDAVCGTSPTAANTDDVMDDGAAPADAAAAAAADDDDDAGGDVGRTRAACVTCDTRVDIWRAHDTLVLLLRRQRIHCAGG